MPFADTDPLEATPADRRRHVGELRRRASDERRAYHSGIAGGDSPPPEAPDSVHQAFQAGVEEAGRRQSSGPGRGGPGPRGPRGSTGPRGSSGRRGSSPRRPGGRIAAAAGRPVVIPTGGDGGGIDIGPQGASFLLGLVGYALVLSYALYGWPGVTGWLSAKFLNQVTVGQGGATVQSSGPSGQTNPIIGPVVTTPVNPSTGPSIPTGTSGQPGTPAFGAQVQTGTVNPTTGGPTP